MATVGEQTAVLDLLRRVGNRPPLTAAEIVAIGAGSDPRYGAPYHGLNLSTVNSALSDLIAAGKVKAGVGGTYVHFADPDAEGTLN